ncbi:Ribosome-releasing factor 2, mitochondrial [Basidiobolus ranarum]|uniref:Ribosome-releasing factor 2, mitochondrial n=1 Tax=Basidiobolus ranarum TaxID=34480 RepID=A0ABR2VXX1_9FUNG
MLGQIRLFSRQATQTLLRNPSIQRHASLQHRGVFARWYTVKTDDPQLAKIRNIGIIAHIDAGKTTSTERMLHYAGMTRKIGDVDDGDTVMDYMKQEKERGITITSAAITFGWKDHRINLIDTPGHVDFTMEVERSIRVLDGAVTIIDGVAGVEAQTETVWTQADRYKVPRIVFINKLDRIGAGITKSLKDIQKRLNGKPLLCQLPVMGDDGLGGGSDANGISGIVDLLTMEYLTWDKETFGASIKKVALKENTINATFYEAACQARVNLVESLSEIDDEIVEIFLENEDHMAVSDTDLRKALRRATLSGSGVPVLCGASFKNIGVQPLMDAVIDYLPSPVDRPLPKAVLPNGELVEIPLLTKGKLCALAFKVIADSKRGPMVFVRVYSGTLQNRSTLYNSTRKGKERVNKLLQMYASDVEEIPSISAGNIGVIIGMKETRTGDTILLYNDRQDGLKLKGVEIPPPVFFCAVEPYSSSDEKSVDEALKSILLEDPSLHVHIDEETGQNLISGMGELHLEIVKDRLLNDFKVNAEMGKMRISYRETVTSEYEEDILYDREMMGKRALAQMKVLVSPLSEEDSGNDETGNRIDIDLSEGSLLQDSTHESADRGNISKEDVLESIREGILSGLSRGHILGFPMTRLQVKVRDVRLFGGDTSPAALRACVNQGLTNAVAKSDPALLEPMMKVVVEVGEDQVGNVLGDLTGVRRGRVTGLDEDSGQESTLTAYNKRSVHAEVPLSSMVGYSSALRSLTAGTATFSMQLVGYGLMTSQQQKNVEFEIRGY